MKVDLTENELAQIVLLIQVAKKGHNPLGGLLNSEEGLYKRMKLLHQEALRNG